MSIAWIERGQGPAIVLVHGWPVSASMWDGQLDALSDEFRVLAVDLPGFGSSPPRSPASITELARSLEEFLAARDLHDVLLAGWSMGAGVVMRYCEAVGLERLAAIGIIEDSPRLQPAPDWPAGAYTTFSDDVVAVWFEAWAQGRRRDVLLEMFSLGFENPDAHAADIEALVEQGLLADPASALAAFQDAVTCDFRGGLPAISVPALLVYGRASQMSTPAVHDFMCASLPDAELHLFDESGHCPMLEEPLSFNDLLRTFAHRVLLHRA
jgi:non-heme chloroperoxidase